MAKKLVGNQKKLDANNNNRIDKQDFELLKGKKEMKKGGQAKRKFYEGGGASTVSSAKLGAKLIEAEERRLKQIEKEEKKKDNKAFIKYADRGTSGDKSLGKALVKSREEADKKKKKTLKGTTRDFVLLSKHGRDAPKDRGFNTRRYANGGAAITKTNQKPHMS
tara:strand:- start:303 stop:794 length:492 start_codon:yes stop_codon:yes gene_type:complete